jgi:hypothetical protein
MLSTRNPRETGSCAGFAEITTKARVYMKGPPKVLNKGAQYHALLGEGAELTCQSFAIPPPSKVGRDYTTAEV